MQKKDLYPADLFGQPAGTGFSLTGALVERELKALRTERVLRQGDRFVITFELVVAPGAELGRNGPEMAIRNGLRNWAAGLRAGGPDIRLTGLDVAEAGH